MPFGRFIANTLLIAGGATLGTLVSSSLAAYAFSRLRWRFRDTVFFLLLLTMMLPGQDYHDSPFCALRQVGLGQHLSAPDRAGLVRQSVLCIPAAPVFMALPPELDDAARIDGASIFAIYWRIMLPLSKPVLATVALFSVQFHWNAFIGPLIYLHDLKNSRPPLGCVTSSPRLR